MQITEQTTLRDVICAIGWEDQSYMVDPMAKLNIDFSPIGKPTFDQLTLQQISAFFSSWSSGSIAKGLQHLTDRCQNGPVFYRYQEDSSTGIAAFTLPQKRKCVIICPGGGYTNVCSIAEGYPIAEALNRMGYAACIVHYHTHKEASAPNPMDDLARAIRFIMDHAEELNIDMEDYALMGFSAGGHLAASFGTEALGFSHYGLPAPKCMILGYPVITMGVYAHEGSRDMLLGKEADPALRDRYSVQQQVTAAYPPTFIWQCEADATVPIQNSRLMVQALAAAGVAHHYEVFPGDAHGWGLGEGTAAEGWLERAIRMWTV